MRQARTRAVRFAHRFGTSKERRQMFAPHGAGTVCTGEGEGFVVHLTQRDGAWVTEWFSPRADVGHALRARIMRLVGERGEVLCDEEMPF